MFRIFLSSFFVSLFHNFNYLIGYNNNNNNNNKLDLIERIKNKKNYIKTFIIQKNVSKY